MTSKPFEEGARVKIIRARHGWHDGRTEGIVTHRYIKSRRSTFSYTVTGDDGILYEVNRTNDLREA